MRSFGEILSLLATVVVAVVIGFGVPLAWVWIGSQLQGGSGASSLNFSVAVAILAGIIASYLGVLYAAGWVMARFGGDGAQDRPRGTADRPWMRGTTDTQQAARRTSDPQVGTLERVFVVTTILVSIAAFIWFFGFAGSPLPSQ